MIFKQNNYLSLYKCREVQDFILKFFEVKKGNRCRVRFGVGRDSVTYYNNEKYRNIPSTKSFVSINKDNIIDELSKSASHFFTHLFDDDSINKGLTNIDNWEYGQFNLEFRKYVMSKYVGITYVIDIDSPKLYPEIEGNIERYDFFEPKIINYFNEATKLVAEELDNIVEYNCMFSGNGFYFILESFYPEDNTNIFDDIISYKDVIEAKLNEVDIKLEELNNPIRIKAKSEGWNRYYKIPFTFHRHKPKISVPLNKRYIGELNPIWLDYITDISTLIKSNNDNTTTVDCGILKEIIKDCQWEKLW